MENKIDNPDLVNGYNKDTKYNPQKVFDDKFDGFYDYVKAEIQKVGAIKINTRNGMLIASNF